ncbi:MAG: hypothetical protein ACT4NL_06785 [Pseudomarimonas sp.]
MLLRASGRNMSCGTPTLVSGGPPLPAVPETCGGLQSAAHLNDSCQPMDIRCIAKVILLTGALLATPSVSPAHSQVQASVGIGCSGTVLLSNANAPGTDSLRSDVLDVCAGGMISFDKSFVINRDSEIASDSMFSIDGSSRWQDASIAGDNEARIRRGQPLRRK